MCVMPPVPIFKPHCVVLVPTKWWYDDDKMSF